ncbi:heme-binding protein [Colwellia echini]|uniref:Heme-binding protein n=1 Tax=Colwellia echini TaxID=1982103 RepID=A0ABY3MYI9_9GAMM|nr:heme-binding protein [Colwellia echini]TYK66291.1 heme-binding protein [Colwellia echini]
MKSNIFSPVLSKVLPKSTLFFFVAFLTLIISGCGEGTDNTAEVSAVDNTPIANSNGDSTANGCIGFCASSTSLLTQADVEQVISQAVAEAQALQAKATIAVTDRMGNVLGVYRMTGSEQFITISSTANTSFPTVVGGLEGVNIIPDTMAAISKAITGSYISSEGNAFTTRTASQIIQENFNPGENNAPSGPLFGVQFSQLACNDFNLRFNSLDTPSAGPLRAPLGLAADPGGFPLYKAGTPVGAIGVISDGIYGLDKVISNFDLDSDELIALAGTFGFAAPLERRADVITIVGKTARFSDALINDLQTTDLTSVPTFTDINNVVGSLVAVPGYYDGGEADMTSAGDINRTVLAGVAFGQPGSGIIPADSNLFKDSNGNSIDAFIFADSNDNNRFPATAASDQPGGLASNQLSQVEVQELLNQAISLANKTRAQIRQPNGSQARVSVSVVDTNGVILGMARTRDAPIFGSDVSLQKARTAAFFSGTGKLTNAPADLLRALPPPLYLAALPEPIDLSGGIPLLTSPLIDLSDYVSSLQTFIGLPQALETTGEFTAFSDRAGGNLSRPNFPDGPIAGPPGPLSKPAGQWSVFSVGLQSDLIYNSLIQHVAFVLGAVPDVGTNCTGNTGFSTTAAFTNPNKIAGLANGIQIFPGSVPIYRGDTLIGGIGVSGDGVDQDDMISFLAVHQAGLALATNLSNAPQAIRADKIDLPNQSIILRYVNCPQAPFINSDEADVCDGI